MRPLFVGEMNPFGADPYFALYPLPETSSGGRLQALVLGIPRGAYIELDRMNLCGGKWSAPAARARAQELWQFFTPATHKFVLLGSKVCGAFQVPFVPFTVQASAVSSGGHTHVVLPHPSGLNRIWNEPGAFQRARALIEQEFPGLYEGERA